MGEEQAPGTGTSRRRRPATRDHRKGAGHGPHRPDHHRRRSHGAHGARGAGYPAEAAGANASRRPGPGSIRIPRRDIVSTSTSRDVEATGNPGQALAVHDDHLATLSGSPTPTSSTPGTPVGGMAMPTAAALPRPVAPRRGSRQIAGRACVQIDRICAHNECTRRDSAAAPKADICWLLERHSTTFRGKVTGGRTSPSLTGATPTRIFVIVSRARHRPPPQPSKPGRRVSAYHPVLLALGPAPVQNRAGSGPRPGRAAKNAKG